MTTRIKLWSDSYRNALPQTLEGKLWLAACYVACNIDKLVEHEEYCRKVAQVAFEQNTNIWHACAVVSGKVETCSCSPCQRTREGR
jgi:hypothetical protein